MRRRKATRRTSGDLRSDILAAAQAVFTERGYAAASTREIAERARAAEPLIFRHFERKSKLFAAAVFEPIERTLDDHLTELRTMYREPRDPVVGTRSYVEAILATIRGNKRLFIAYLNAITFHADEFINTDGSHTPPSFQARLSYLERTSSEVQRSSQLVILDRHFEIRLILLFLFSVGLFDDLFFSAPEQDDERVVTSVVKLLTMGIGVGSPGPDGGVATTDVTDKPRQAEVDMAACRQENQQLRSLLADAMLDLHTLRSAVTTEPADGNSAPRRAIAARRTGRSRA